MSNEWWADGYPPEVASKVDQKLSDLIKEGKGKELRWSSEAMLAAFFTRAPKSGDEDLLKRNEDLQKQLSEYCLEMLTMMWKDEYGADEGRYGNKP